jgi:CelD/BcsL family acetyltransferase involved in cellulose biosynthesis
LAELTTTDEQAWRDLASRAVEPNPFAEPDCLVPYGLVPVGPHERFRAGIEVALAEEGGRVYACLPTRSVGAVGKLLYPFISAEVREMECGTPLVDNERGTQAMAVILSGLSRQRQLRRARVLNIVRISQDGPAYPMVQAAARNVGFPMFVHESYERGLLKRRQSEGLADFQDHKFSRELRRLGRRLSEQAGADVRLVDQSSDPMAAERYLDMERSGYKARTHAAITVRPGEPEWYRELCRRFAANGRLHVFGLVAGDETVAITVWLRAGKGLFNFKMAYDERYSRCSPGLQLMVASVDRLLSATDADWFDCCSAAGNEMLLRLYPDRRRSCSVFVPLGKNSVDWAVAASFAAFRPLHRRAYERRHRGEKLKGGGQIISGPGDGRA